VVSEGEAGGGEHVVWIRTLATRVGGGRQSGEDGKGQRSAEGACWNQPRPVRAREGRGRDGEKVNRG